MVNTLVGLIPHTLQLVTFGQYLSRVGVSRSNEMPSSPSLEQSEFNYVHTRVSGLKDGIIVRTLQRR